MMAKINKKIMLAVVIFAAIVLRLWKLNDMPVSLFGDELDVGYHAYSLFATGRDYSGNFLPFHLHSLSEWRTPLYLYSAVPTVAIFGISPLGVRLPAVIFGVLNIVAFYFLVGKIRTKYLKTKNWYLEIIASLFLAISPWHIQYSRAGFEVTLLLLFLFAGTYFFFRGLEKGKYLYIASLCFALMPWVYSTAKLFVPIFVFGLLVVYLKELLKLKKKDLMVSGVIFVLVSLPIIFSILFGGGAQRFGYVSVFSDPTMEHKIGISRDLDSFQDTIGSRVFHNKYVAWGAVVGNNFLQAYSADFLFIRGDINLRHSVDQVGMFYKVEVVALLLGIVTFFSVKRGSRIKMLIVLWLVAGTIPSAITRDGGNHATRLILILPPLSFLVSYGVHYLVALKDKVLRLGLLFVYFFVLVVCFVHYQHQFWVHNPLNSERWWHYGWEEAIGSVKELEGDFDKVVISTADEPPWIFFAGWYEYPPSSWQDNFPLDQKIDLAGFGEISYIDKFYFGSPEEPDVYSFGKVIDKSTLYLASAKEVGPDLVGEPERTPPDLNLIKAIAYPSGEPAFYLFSGK